MPDMPYDKLSAMPAIDGAPLEDESTEPLDPDAAGLDPHLRTLGQEMGLNPKQTAALKEFVAACSMSDAEEYDDPEMG